MTTEAENFKLYVELVLLAEDRFSDDEDDRGGITHWGLSAKFMKSIGRTGGAPTREEVVEIYRQYFWRGWR